MPEVCDNARLGRGFVHHMRPSAGVHRWMSFERVLLGLVVAALALSCSREVPSDQPVTPSEAPPSIVATPVAPTPVPQPTTTFVPLPTAPTLSPAPGGELLIACDGPPFSVSMFDRPANGELDPHPAAAFFRSMNVEDTGMYAPVTEGWWMLPDQPTQVWFLARFSDDWFEYYRVDFGPEGWSSNRSGECNLWPAVGDEALSTATWELDPEGASPRPSSTSVDLLVTELACTGGARVDDRLLAPAVIYGPESVMIIVAAVPLPATGDCLRGPSAKLRVEFREPLGDRTVRGWVPPPECCG